MIKKCKVCGYPFKTYPCRLKGNSGHKALFCSKSCANKYNQNGKKTRFKKGHILSENRNLPIGKKHFAWKGNKVSYRGLHQWVIRKKGYPKICSKCGKLVLNHRFIHWANIDHKYRRNLNDFISLCKSCHTIYDKQFIST